MPLHPCAERVLLHFRQYSESMRNVIDLARGMEDHYAHAVTEPLTTLRAYLEEWRQAECPIQHPEVARFTHSPGRMRPDEDYPSYIWVLACECGVQVPALQLLSSLGEFCVAWQREFREPCLEIESYCPPISTWRVRRYVVLQVEQRSGEVSTIGIPMREGRIPLRPEFPVIPPADNEWRLGVEVREDPEPDLPSRLDILREEE